VSKTLEVAGIVLPVIISFALGWFCRGRKIISPEGMEGLKKLALSFALPATLFGIFFNADYSADILICAATLFVVLALGLIAGFILRRISKSPHPTLAHMTSCTEVGMMGYAFYILLFGSENLHHMATADLGQTLFCFLFYITTLGSGGGNKRTVGQIAKDTFKSPVIWGMLSGVILGALGVDELLEPSGVSALVTTITDFIAAPLSCVILFVVGYGIDFNRKVIISAIRSVFAHYISCVILCILTLTIITYLIPVSDLLRWAIILMFTLPASYCMPLYIKDKDERSYVSVCLSLQTIVSLVLLIVIAFMTR